MIRRSAYGRSWIEGKACFAFALVIASLLWYAAYQRMGAQWLLQLQDQSVTPLWQCLVQWVKQPVWAWCIGFGLLIAVTVLIQQLQYTLALIREKTGLPFLFFLLFISSNPAQLPLMPQLFAGTCFILALYQLYASYHISDSYKQAFNWGFLLGVGALVWSPLLWLLPLFWYGMYHLRSLSGRSFGASFVGVITPFWLVLGVCARQHDYQLFHDMVQSFIQFDLNIWGGGIYAILSVSCVFVLTLVSSFHIFLNEFRDNERTRQYLSLTFVIAIYTFCFSLLFEGSANAFLFLNAVTASILVSHFFTVNWNKWLRLLFICTLLYFLTIFILRIWIY
jgi:hypothetical protein